jgi:predicted amidohydrolase
VRVGLAQIPLRMGEKRANVAAVLRYVAAAARARCDVVVFPECVLAGWCSPAARACAEPVPGPLTRRLGRLARRRRLAVVVGMEERDGARLYNSAVFIGRDGRILARHRKVNELEIGRRLYECGESLGVVEWEGRRVGLDICADSWEPEITDGLVGLGAELIFSPCAWAVEPGGERTNLHWIAETYRARTKGRRLLIVAPNSVGAVTQGPWKGRIFQGDSLVVGPNGRRRMKGPTSREALLTVQL